MNAVSAQTCSILVTGAAGFTGYRVPHPQLQKTATKW
jgi:hypothetical protein